MEVHAWPCSVSIGDAAIHLLVDLTATPTGKLGTIQRAVLIDGGTYTNQDNELYALIAFINKDYAFADNARFDDPEAPTADLQAKQLRFDSVVITHWDCDHYMGVTGLIRKGTEDYVNAALTPDYFTTCGRLHEIAFKRAFLTLCKSIADKEAVQSEDESGTSVSTGLESYLGKDVQEDPSALTTDDAVRSRFDAFSTKLTTGGLGEQTRKPLYYRLINQVHQNGLKQSPPMYYDVFERAAESPQNISVKCRYLKYNTGYSSNCSDFDKASFPVANNTNSLASTMYVPYVAVPGHDIIGPHAGEQADGSSRTITINSIELFKTPTPYNPAGNNKLSYYFNTPPYSLPFPFSSAFNREKKEYDAPPPRRVFALRSVDLCKVVATFGEYLGAELFFQTPIGTTQANAPTTLTWQNATSPLTLTQRKGMISTSGPRMFIIAGDQRLIGNRPLVAINDPNLPPTNVPGRFHQPNDKRALGIHIRPREMIVNIPDANLGLRPPGDRDDIRNTTRSGRSGDVNASVKNSASIVTMTLGVTSAGAAASANDIKMCYYSGGDVTWDVEGGLAMWFSGGRVISGVWTNGTDRYQVDVLKMSHHGAREETSINLLEVLHPRFVIASNPSAQTHGHPTIDVAIAMDAYRARMLNAMQTAVLTDNPSAKSMTFTPSFICLNHPWFFSKEKFLESLKAWSLDAVTLITGTPAAGAMTAIRNFQDTIQSWYGTTSTNILNTWNNDQAANIKTLADAMTAKDKFTWRKRLMGSLIDVVMKVWNQNSIVGLDNHIHGLLFRLDSVPFNGAMPWKHGLWNSEDGLFVFPPPLEFSLSIPLSLSSSFSSFTPPQVQRTMPRTVAQLYARWAGPKTPKLARTIAEGNSDVREKRQRVTEADYEDARAQLKADTEAKEKDQKQERDLRRGPLTPAWDDPNKIGKKPRVNKPRLKQPKDESKDEKQEETEDDLFVERKNIVAHLPFRDSKPTIGNDPSTLVAPYQPQTLPSTIQNLQQIHQNPVSEVVRATANSTPILANAVIRDIAPNPSPFYLYCSDFTPNQLPANAGILDGAASNVFNTFMRSTIDGYVVLDQQLGPTSPTSQLHATDPWLNILSSSSAESVVITIGGTALPNTQQCSVTSIAAQVQLGSNLSLSFSTEATKAVMSPPQQPTTPAVSDYYQDDYSILVLGLTNGIASISLQNIVTAIGPMWLAGVLDILQLGGDFNFQLDASPGSRSAYFMFPDDAKTNILRLRFVLAADNNFLANLQSVLPFKGVTLNKNDTAMTLLRTFVCNNPTDESMLQTAAVSKVLLETSITFTSSTSQIAYTVLISMLLSTGRIKTVFRFQNAHDSSVSIADALDDILAWLFATIDPGDGSTMSGDPKTLFPSIGSVDLALQQVTVEFSLPTTKGQKMTMEKLEVHLEVKLWEAVFAAKIMYPCFQLQANLLRVTPSTFADFNINMLPWWEPFELVIPVNLPNACLDITKTPFGATPPAGLQSGLEDADLLIQVSPFQAYIGATIEVALPATSDMPTPLIDTISLRALYADGTATGTGTASWDVDVDSQFILYPRNYDPTNTDLSPAYVDLDADISSDGWTISLSVWSLDFGTIYDLFDANAQESVMDILDHLWIDRLSLTYTHPKNSQGSFAADGLLILGPIALEIDYSFDQATRDWSFTAAIDSFDNNATAPLTVLGLVQELVKADPAASFLEFLDDIPFIRDVTIPSATDDGGDPPLMLSIQHESDYVLTWFMARIKTDVGMFHLTLLQISPARPSQSNLNNEKPDPTVKGPLPKRILRLRLDSLPNIGPVPVVGMIDQPVDSLDYLLVLDENHASTPNPPPMGLTQAEIDAINLTLPPADALQYKSISKPASALPAGSPTPIVLLAGHHFIAVSDGAVIVDHIFGGGSTKAASAGTNSLDGTAGDGDAGENHNDNSGGGKSTSQTAASEDTGTTLGPTKKSPYGLAIDNFGLKCKDNYLFLMLDAKVMLGPIELDLVGFGVGLPLSKISDWKTLTPSDFQLTIKGVGVDFNQPPIAIAGFFEKNATDLFEEYLGGLMVSILPYTLVAVGAYRHTFSPDFKSVFVFASLDGPLVSLEFAEISGVAAGFGYQYSLRLPFPSEVQNFPFVHGQQAQTNPMSLMSTDTSSPSNFNNWITAQQDTLFFAVGMKVDSFEILSVDAALIVAFDGPYPKFALVGIASASMPPSQTKKPEAFVYVEMGIVAALDTVGGTFVVGAQLTNNSYIIYPDVHLTGGMALCYWFGASPHAGDWVFSIGGYHPAYSKPDHYPDVPRVGISWNLSDVLTIQGEAYFAVTPKCAMAGGRLQAVLSAGPIYASLEAWANFMVNFRPFFFIADIGICITVGFHIDIGIIHIHIDCSLSASLNLQGPPFGGVAHVDFSLHPFDVYFGNQPGPPPPLTWDDTADAPGFLSLVKQPGPNANDSKDMAVIALNTGAAASSMSSSTDRQTGEAWFIRAGQFSWRLNLKFPVDATIVSDGIDDWVHDGGSGGLVTVLPANLDSSVASIVNSRPQRIYARPMQQQDPCTSVVHITVLPPDVVKIPQPWRVTAIVSEMPNAVWAKYDASLDPIQSGNNIGALLSTPSDKGTTPLVTGFIFNRPRSVWPTLEIPPFNALTEMFEDVFDNVDNPCLPPNASAQASVTAKNDWASAEPLIKADVSSVVDAQALADDIAALMSWSTSVVTVYPQMMLTQFEDAYLECPWVMWSST